MSVVVPDMILEAAQLSEDELKLEIAIMLYTADKISSGMVRSWTGLSVIEFQHQLAKRDLYLNYDVEDLEADIETLKSLDLL
ncbi:UPF0175 family protein [Leptolyngbya cf. ectocarpi LEGE 11479]|uniref:UPF0175 family protein n=1 Tax=Leptolyngbya cf. ectocarpi LEGE 11479 TaxID=1828722 RepID=A0A929FCG5_LEPEC|nr:UPF0175 family protein [Leptolyngbya ectocarpi]MBE9070042.1 UPF0175 family protein [Leptolyngbya cf. ectocarpi LEGE 11479]